MREKTNLLVDAGHSGSTERVLRCSENLQAQTPTRGTRRGRGPSQAIQRGQEQSQIGNKRQQKEQLEESVPISGIRPVGPTLQDGDE